MTLVENLLGLVHHDTVGLEHTPSRLCSAKNLENCDDGSVGTLTVLGADWSVITKCTGVFDLININGLSLSVVAIVGCPLICCVGTDQLLTSDINPSVVRRTFKNCFIPCRYFFFFLNLYL